jgi:serine/threonine-protein kinase
MIQIGDQFDRFQIQGHIAHGGMGDVYRAYDLVNRREVALKVPDASMIGDPAQYERFQREIEVLQRLDHPAVLHGLGCGRFNRTPYLVMELLEGVSLRTFIEDSAPLKPEEAVPLMLKIADGMAYAHENEVVHRDLKPENIILKVDGQPVIMDFGLALTKNAHRVTYSNLTAAAGTPDYMAPEQVEGKRGDERTDVYALGVILYELLAGQVPFGGDSNLAVMAQRLQSSAPRLDKQRAGISPALAAVVAKTLQRDPERRYASMTDFIAALEHPEQADLTILEQTNSAPEPWWKSGFLKAIGLGLLIFLGIILLSLALQALKP